jgi:hypothetical protein
MKIFALISVVLLAAAILLALRLGLGGGTTAPAASPAARTFEIENDAIDMDGFLLVANQAAVHREPRRVTEEEFLRMSGEPGTVILDARSREMFDLLHVEGAINLPFPDIDIESLAKIFPDKEARILIYCNNNFENEERAMRRKMAPASLNLSTYVSLYTYGYRNIYELGPRKDPRDSKMPLVGTLPEYHQ